MGALLNALNESSGSILENDKVINTLTTLKNEALDFTQKVEETEVVFEEITRVSQTYHTMSSFCSRIFFAMEQLSTVHFLYQFSLRFFLDMFNDILHNNTNLQGIQDPTQRLEILVKDLFITIYRRVCRTLLHEDQLTFALRMAQIRLTGSSNEFPADEIDFFMKGGENIAAAGGIPELSAVADLLSEAQQRYISELQGTVKLFQQLGSHLQSNRSEWETFFSHPQAESSIPSSWEEHIAQTSSKTSKVLQYFRRLIILKSLRPDRLMSGIQQTVSQVFGEEYLQPMELDLSYVIEKESNASSPLLLASMPGHDAVGLVDDLAAKMKKQMRAIAIGSPEGFELAEKSIYAATKSGGWVLLKNIHLAPQWLSKLEKKLHSLNPNKNFRLFMTSEIHPKIPASLLRQSHIFSFEPPPGVKANMLHTLSAVDQGRMEQKPRERARLYFMLAWFHALTQERLRYAPLGWSKMFEFGDTDKRCALETIDYWIDSAAQGRDNIDPERIPWEAIRTLLGQSVYGGRIDNEFDQRLLDSFLEQTLSPKCYDVDFTLVEFENGAGEKERLSAPEGMTKREFLAWVQQLPEAENPAWLGLPSNAEVLLLVNQSKRLVARFLKMQSIQLDDSYSGEDGQQATQGGGRPQWAVTLLKFVDTWKDLLPKSLADLERTAKSVSDPLFRFFEREVALGQQLLGKIHRDLETLTAVAEGTSLSARLVDFTKRIQQLQKMQESHEYGKCVWMGGLFNPEAFMTATRQAAARAHTWSLENLQLTAQVLSSEEFPAGADEAAFIARGLILEAASWDASAQEMVATDEMSSRMPPILFTWKLIEDAEKEKTTDHARVILPVYLNEMRLELLFSVVIHGPKEVSPHVWYQRGVALLTTRPL